MSKATIILNNIKDPDGWGLLAEELQLSEEAVDQHLEWGEYANLEVVIDSNLRIVGGRVIPLREVTP